jgi:arylsulfatase A-like enzyme
MADVILDYQKGLEMPQSRARGKRPNILFIVADDLGFADLGCTGRLDVQTPNIDALASVGVRFTQSYANSCLCTNTRVAILTGQYQYRHTVGLVEPLRHALREEKGMGLPAGTPTLASMLKDVGYSTALIGKWHVGELPLYGPLKSGYDSFFGIMGGYCGYFTHHGEDGYYDLYQGEELHYEDGYLTHMFSDRAVRHVREAAKHDVPFLLSLHYNAPHWPWSAPSCEEASRERESDPSMHADGGNLAIFAEMVAEMDRGIGQVIDALREAGRLNNTLIIFTSDNGGERFSHLWPFVGRKRDLLEGGLRIPQIIAWADQVAGGRTTDQLCISMDLTATCLEAAGASPPAGHDLDGISLLPIVVDGAETHSRNLFWRQKERDQIAVRSGRWKYLKVGAREFLFDLDYDARERTNFAKSYPDRMAEMKALWQAWNDGMLPIPKTTAPIYSNLSDMLW